MSDNAAQAVALKEVMSREWEAISAQRAIRSEVEPWFRDPKNRFGVALSGGGIRSATISFGFLEVLNRFGVLSRADFLSTVSGGGYLGGYVHSKLWHHQGGQDPFQELFSAADRNRLESYGKYLTPGSGARRAFNRLKLGGALVGSVLMNWAWIFALLLFLFFLVSGFWRAVGQDAVAWFGRALLVGTASVLVWHLFLHPLRHLKLWSSDLLNSLEGTLLVAAVFYGTSLSVIGLAAEPPMPDLVRAGIALIVFAFVGFFSNPNLLTLHRFYRDRLGAAYLSRARNRRRVLKLHELAPQAGGWRDAPYPLINTCLNLLGVTDPGFQGTQSSDYFLLSPLYCGSKLTGYAPTAGPSYRMMTLATAVACSGAAVNPGMGVGTNKLLAFLMTLLNLRLGYWVCNPHVDPSTLRSRIPWWPYYQILELLSRTDSRRRLVNISDGGHIENLGVYELLRRRCRLIIALDAGADPDYGFSDLKNLVIRARQELGVVITFRQNPEEYICPLPSNGFSDSHFVIADIAELAGKPDGEEPYTGLLVYVKSSLRAQQRWKRIDSGSFAYKTYHPAFPHETTADQFFDEVQWRAYYRLGRFIAGDLLQVDATNPEASGLKRIEKLYETLAAVRTGPELESYLSQ